MTHLPVDRIIPQIQAALEKSSTVIIQAPPGSGKSTRIPLALLTAGWLQQNKVLMLEPRRLAAINLAAWISAGIGEAVGGRVGYSIRFDRKVSAATRLEIVTEGILTRRLQSDPYLDGTGAVIFDEFHERSIHTDTALALCLYLQRTVRPDLKIVIMSATLETRSIAALIPEAEIVTCEGKLYPVEIRYLGNLDADIAKSAAKAAVLALKDSPGDILVFLPGAREIRKCLTILQQQYRSSELLIVPLYGDLPFADQEKALQVAATRKVVLATNIAETSLTIEGVRVVIDSGLARKARFDQSRALDRLVTEQISLASAVQRAGRSGRTAPGICYRLWSEYEQKGLLAFDPPEILISDLCDLALNLALWGVHDPAELAFPDQPPVAALGEARRVLKLLAALDADDRITSKGKRLAGLPLHPRLAALLLAAVDEGAGSLGADIAAILSERDFSRPLSRERTITSSDLADRLELLSQWRKNPGSISRSGEVDSAALRTVERLSGQLQRTVAVSVCDCLPESAAVSLLAATAFPDRVARQREPGSRRYLLASGRGAVLEPQSGLLHQEFIVALRMDAGAGGEGRIFSASSLEFLPLKEKFAAAIFPRRTAVWDTSLRRVTAREEEMLGAITLGSRVVKACREDVLAAVLEQIHKAGDNGIFIKSPQAAQYQARVAFVRAVFPAEEWPDLAEGALLLTAADWLPGFIDSLVAPEKFCGVDLLTLFKATLGWKKEGELERLAPLTMAVPSGSRIKIDYSAEGGPFIAVKLQELFGLGVTPRIAEDRVPLLIHLLSPAGRPIQITSDLKSFWANGYLQVKKELKGRYPRHCSRWPNDPLSLCVEKPESPPKKSLNIIKKPPK